MRIPIAMCHGTSRRRQPPLDAQHLEGHFRIAAELGFQSISYDDLARWRAGEGTLPQRPIMFDFDHPAASIRHEILPLMEGYGFAGNLFVHTAPLTKAYPTGEWMTWGEIRELMEAGWHIGSHMHNHFKMSYLAQHDPSGALIRQQFERCDALLKANLGVVSKDFAYTSTTWSRVAEEEVKKRYRFGRLWIIGTHYETDEGPVRFAELSGVTGPDEADGGPPHGARYITRETDAYRLPSMELEYLIYEADAFRRYLEGALAP